MKTSLLLMLTFFLLSPPSFPQWVNQNPVPEGNRLRSVFFVDDNTGWITGSGGLILKTTDAGQSWIPQLGGTSLYIKSACFTDPFNGCVVGEAGLILKTTDGGSSWFQVASNVTDTLNCIRFADSQNGWIVGYNGKILNTTNGGYSWFIQNSGTSLPLFSCDFVTQNLGWAVGADISDPQSSPLIIKTTNGGITWLPQNPNMIGVLYSVDFVDSLTGWAAGDWYNIRMQSGHHAKTQRTQSENDGNLPETKDGYIRAKTQGTQSGNDRSLLEPKDGYIILKTTNGGINWFVQAQNSYSDAGNSARERNSLLLNPVPEDGPGGIYSIFFKDADHGWTVSGHNSYDRKIMATTDGGTHWNIMYCPTTGLWNEENDLYSVWVTAQGNGWAVGLGGGIFIKDAGSDQWVQQFSGSDNSGSDDIKTIFMIDGNIGWAAGIRENYFDNHDPVILKTTNAGQIWKTQYYGYGYNMGIVALYFINQLTGWRIDEEGGLSQTTNGGESWTSLSYLYISNNPFMYFKDESTGFLCSNDIFSPGIYKSADAGYNWNQVSSDIINSLSFYQNTGLAVGSDGIILKSTDNGDTWETKSSGVSNNLLCGKFFDSNTGIISGAGNLILRTTDGGDSWISGNGPAMNAVNFINAATVWGYTTDGAVYKSFDAGNSWQPLNTGLGTGETSSFVNEYTGWVGGGNGLIYRYSAEPVLPPLWTNHISVSDAGGTDASQILTFGQQAEATDSIDASLGENELSPTPPAGVFDARFNLPTDPPVSSLMDYRNGSKTEIIWKMTFQPGPANYPMSFRWDSAAFPAGSFYLKDQINGSQVFVNMKNQGSCLLTNPAISSLEIGYSGICSPVTAKNKWNMISVPMLAEDMKKTNIFPTAISDAFYYDTTYHSADTLKSGTGYWLRFDGDQVIQVCGTALADTVNLIAGWNLFGISDKDIPLDQITTTPPSIIISNFFSYSSQYYSPDTLKSGGGYWIQVNSDGVLHLNSSSPKLNGVKQNIAKIKEEWGKIIISDNGGGSITLYGTNEEVNSIRYELPPLPPEGTFDARFSTGKFAEDLRDEKIIEINSDNYPVTIKAEGMNLSIKDGITGQIVHQELKNGDELKINDKRITSLIISGKTAAGLPVSFELYQNYPNPFNPTTKIKFSIPKEMHVSISVFNVLGEKVRDLKNEVMKPGYFEINFDGTELSSGVYFYRISAGGNFIRTRKMMLLK